MLHGDVHPRNALVLHDGSVRLIDFGLADSGQLAAELRPHERGGVGFFLEPEFAHARLDGHRPPRLNAMGEQYSLAALVYLVLTGSHYLRFSPEKQAMRRQIVEEAPITFLDAGLARARPWRRSFDARSPRIGPSGSRRLRTSPPASVPPRALIAAVGGSARAIRSSRVARR